MAPRAPDPVTLPAGLDRRVEAAARDRFGPCSVTRMDVMPGGHSGATHLVELDVGGVTRPIVVKSTPPGRRPVGRHDVLRQARVLDAVRRWGALPIPAVLFADVQPPPFYGMEHVAGRATEPILDEPSPDESERRVAEAWDAAIGLLARLHSAPIAELDLGEEVIRTPLGELERWRSTMRAAQMSDSPAAERLCQALANAAPDEGRAALLHGDYRLGNLVMVGAKPRGLLDWEIWSLGDPVVDLGWFVHSAIPATSRA